MRTIKRNNKPIHVVVTAYDEEGMIERVVEGVKRLRLRIWVVDDGTEDGTMEQAKKAGASVITYKSR